MNTITVKIENNYHAECLFKMLNYIKDSCIKHEGMIGIKIMHESKICKFLELGQGVIIEDISIEKEKSGPIILEDIMELKITLINGKPVYTSNPYLNAEEGDLGGLTAMYGDITKFSVLCRKKDEQEFKQRLYREYTKIVKDKMISLNKEYYSIVNIFESLQ